MPWLPEDFAPPVRADLPTGHHLRPIRARDAEIDLPAVNGSQSRLWRRYGDAWGWPPERGITIEEDREDLAHHEQEMVDREGYNYAVLDEAEERLSGCVYVYPSEAEGHDADVSWWVREEDVGTPLEGELDAFVPRWVTSAWPFTRPRVWP